MFIALCRIFCWGTRTHQLQCMGSVVVLHWLSCSWACGILVPWLGMEPISPALQGSFLTTRLPGKFPQTVISFGSFVFSQALKRALGSFPRMQLWAVSNYVNVLFTFFFSFFSFYRNNWLRPLCKFKVYNIVIWLTKTTEWSLFVSKANHSISQ